jgi:hypothetical protein
VLLVVGAAVVGCSSDDSMTGAEPAVQRTVHAYLDAVSRGDGRAACAQLTARTRRLSAVVFNTNQHGVPVRSCPEAVERFAGKLSPRAGRTYRAAEVEPVKVSGNSATAGINGVPRQVRLVKIQGRWYVSGGLF